MRRYYPVIPPLVVLLLTSTNALAQATIGGGGGGLGDQAVNWVFQNFLHALASAGLIALIIGALVMRSHLMYFLVGGMALLALGNYTSILAVAGL